MRPAPPAAIARPPCATAAPAPRPCAPTGLASPAASAGRLPNTAPRASAAPPEDPGIWITHSVAYPPGVNFADPARRAAAEAAARAAVTRAPGDAPADPADPPPSTDPDDNPETDPRDDPDDPRDDRNHDREHDNHHDSAGARRRRRGHAAPTDLPLSDRVWDHFCQGHSFTTIGRLLHIDRETAARHVHRIHTDLAADRRADQVLALTRAIEATHQLQARAWDMLAREEAREDEDRAAPASGRPGGADAGVLARPYRANRARLLAIILAAIREAARLELLYDPTGPAHAAEAVPTDPTILHLFIHSSPPDDEATPGTAPAGENPHRPDSPSAPGAASAPDVATPSATAWTGAS